MPSTLSVVTRGKIACRVGLTAGPCARIAGLAEQNPTPQLSPSGWESHPGQPSDPPIGTVSPGPSSCAIGIANATADCPASPRPRATSRSNARRRANRPCLMTRKSRTVGVSVQADALLTAARGQLSGRFDVTAAMCSSHYWHPFGLRMVLTAIILGVGFLDTLPDKVQAP